MTKGNGNDFADWHIIDRIAYVFEQIENKIIPNFLKKSLTKTHVGSIALVIVTKIVTI